VGVRALSGEQLATFKNLMHRVDRRTTFRHKLAHWAIGYAPIKKGDALEDLEGFEVALMPPIFSAHARITPHDDQPIHPNQIEEFSEKCTELFSDIIALSDQLKNKAPSP
jgi:hypothetical protein